MTVVTPFPRRSRSDRFGESGNPPSSCHREGVSPSAGDHKPHLPRHRGSRRCRDGDDGFGEYQMTGMAVRGTAVRNRLSLAHEKDRFQAHAASFTRILARRPGLARGQRAPRHGY
jgi:hypothetical protein